MRLIKFMIYSIIILIILILINAFFAASEIAFISLNEAKIELQIKERKQKSKIYKKDVNKP